MHSNGASSDGRQVEEMEDEAVFARCDLQEVFVKRSQVERLVVSFQTYH